MLWCHLKSFHRFHFYCAVLCTRASFQCACLQCSINNWASDGQNTAKTSTQEKWKRCRETSKKQTNCANNLIDIRKHSAAKAVILLYYLFGENIAGPVKWGGADYVSLRNFHRKRATECCFKTGKMSEYQARVVHMKIMGNAYSANFHWTTNFSGSSVLALDWIFPHSLSFSLSLSRTNPYQHWARERWKIKCVCFLPIKLWMRTLALSFSMCRML